MDDSMPLEGAIRASVLLPLLNKITADEMEISQDGCDFERVGEIRIAGCAPLIGMRFHGINVGSIEQVFVSVGVVRKNALHQFVLAHHGRHLARRR